MTDPTPVRYDEAALAAADEATLERRRWTLVRAADDRRQILIDHLMTRAMPAVARTTVRLGDAAGLPRAAVLLAGEEAAVTLLMRLHTPQPLPPVTELARTVAAVAVRAHAGEPGMGHPSAPAPRTASAPRLADRRPHLRVIEGGAA
jgi:hypothetical protein